MRRVPYPDTLRGIGIVFVVAIHSFAYLRLPIDGAWAVPWFLIDQIAVPSFFLAEGWLHARRYRDAMAATALRQWFKRRCRRLLLPWAIFSLLYLALRLANEHFGHAGGLPVLSRGLVDLPRALWFGAAAGQLYFLPALLLVELASFALHPPVRRRPYAAALLAIGLISAWRIGIEPSMPVPASGVDPLGAALLGLGFAATGWALFEAELAGIALRHVLVIAASLAVSGAFLGQGLGTNCLQLAYLLGIWWLVRHDSEWRIWRIWRGGAWLGRRSMGIYLLHAPILVKLVSDALLRSAVPPPAALALDVTAVLALAVAASWGVERLGLAPVVFGAASEPPRS